MANPERRRTPRGAPYSRWPHAGGGGSEKDWPPPPFPPLAEGPAVEGRSRGSSASSLTRLRRFVAAAAPARLWLSRSRWLRREGAEPGAAAAAAVAAAVSLQVPPGCSFQSVSRSLLSGELRSNLAAQDVTSASRLGAEDGRRPCKPEAPKGKGEPPSRARGQDEGSAPVTWRRGNACPVSLLYSAFASEGSGRAGGLSRCCAAVLPGRRL